MKKLILTEEINKIKKIIGVISEANYGGGLTEFLEKLGITGEKLAQRLESMGNREAQTLSREFIEKSKKAFLDEMDKSWMKNMVIRFFPEAIDKFVSTIEQKYFANNPKALSYIEQMLETQRITIPQIATYIEKNTPIAIGEEGLQLWREFRLKNPKHMVPVGQRFGDNVGGGMANNAYKPTTNVNPTVNTTKPTTNFNPTVNTTPKLQTPVTSTASNVSKGVDASLDVAVEGTTDGFKLISGGKEIVGDIRQKASEARAQGKELFTLEKVEGDKKIFTLINTNNKDHVGRAGYMSASVSVPVNSGKTINDVLPTLENALDKEMSKWANQLQRMGGGSIKGYTSKW